MATTGSGRGADLRPLLAGGGEAAGGVAAMDATSGSGRGSVEGRPRFAAFDGALPRIF